MDFIFKLIDISLIGLYFFFGGVLVSHIINRITITYGEMDIEEINKIPMKTIIYHLCKEIILITLFTYSLKFIIKNKYKD